MPWFPVLTECRVQDTDSDIVERVLEGDRKAAARLMRIVDDRDERYVDLLGRIFPRTGRALVIGIAGSPGCGKSTIVDALITSYRRKGRKVGVVAIDPTSSLSGGAILGDRVRMQHHSLDEGVFIRSVATRGAQGGISPSTVDMCRIMDAMGMDVVIVETVGIGQDEVDVRMAVNVSVVVLSPDTGDSIQIMKAGVMEIADVFVVNKMDKDGAEHVCRELEMFLAMTETGTRPEIVRMKAVEGEGARKLEEAVAAFREPAERRKEKGRLEMRKRMNEFFNRWLDTRLGRKIDETVELIEKGRETPYGMVKKIRDSMDGWTI